MRAVALLVVFACSFSLGQQQSASSRLDLPLQQRLDSPQRVAAASVRLTDFVSFIATSFKVPMLVETISPVPELRIPAGTHTARQLLDEASRQLHGFEWKDEGGVAHLYNRRLAKSHGNLLNVRIHRFSFPRDVAMFLYGFRPCISSTVQGNGCEGGVYSGFLPADLAREQLPYLETFEDVQARTILIRALQANGRFYVLVAFESKNPVLTSQFPYLNWFSQSLVPVDAVPMWVQTPSSIRR